MLIINCECGFIIRGESKDDLLSAAVVHIEDGHPELVGKVTAEELLSSATETQPERA